MRSPSSIAAGIGAGALAMYFSDPEHGRRRRALLRDRVAHTTRITRDAMGATSRDLTQRTRGTAAQLKSAFAPSAVDDETLTARVRAKLGRVVSHPGAIEVLASDGVVTLRGPILNSEVQQLLRTVERVRGVRHVVAELEEHKTRNGVPALQGGATPPGIIPDVWQDQWSPTTRLMAGTTGVALMAYCAKRRDLPGTLIGLLGFGLCARAITNLDTGRVTGFSQSRRAIDIDKTITVDAPIDVVYAFWSAYENFPRFMSRVLEVRPGSFEGQSHWTVTGPAGTPVQFDAEVTRSIPNELLAWRTVEGSPIGHAGVIRFEPTPDRRTRVQIRMTYNPPGGWLGHAIAAAFGADPKSSLDADLVRMKSLIETGRPPRDAAMPI
jgi:uncharacterized membrane protein